MKIDPIFLAYHRTALLDRGRCVCGLCGNWKIRNQGMAKLEHLEKYHKVISMPKLKALAAQVFITIDANGNLILATPETEGQIDSQKAGTREEIRIHSDQKVTTGTT